MLMSEVAMYYVWYVDRGDILILVVLMGLVLKLKKWVHDQSSCLKCVLVDESLSGLSVW